MKKILFVTPSLTMGGMERMQVTLANALDRAGYDVTILLLNPDYTLATELSQRVTVKHKAWKEFPIRRKIKYIWTFYDDGVWETRATPRQLYNYYVGKEKYDIEIAFFRGMPIKIVSGSTNSKAIHLAWVHSDFERCVGYQNYFKSMETVYEAYKTFDKVICVSKQANASFKKVVGDTKNVMTIYNLLPVKKIQKLSLEVPKVPVKKKCFHVVLVGRLLDSAKGQKRLIRVISQLHSEGYDVSLTLVGDGKDYEIIKEQIHQQEAESYIFMVGNQQNPYPYITEAQLLVCASYFEGYNLTVAEALLCGTPVLSTKCTGPCEILDNGKYGMIVENSEKGIYLGIKTFLEQPQLLERYREKVAERRKLFEERKILKQIIELFERGEK